MNRMAGDFHQRKVSERPSAGKARSLMNAGDSFPASKNVHVTGFVNGVLPATGMTQLAGQFVWRNCCAL